MNEEDKKKETNDNKKSISRRDALKRMAVFGAGAFGIVTTSSCDLFYYDYSDYFDYEDYSDYDDYSEYYSDSDGYYNYPDYSVYSDY